MSVLKSSSIECQLENVSPSSDMPLSQVQGGAGRGGTKVRAGGRVLQCLRACESLAHLHTKRRRGRGG
ncbi:hypothetical protein E2C01_068219 [Portunus trituberculatus]|uniref:Uncharacterized protein n=1 Tax=Portunus trituberculatus TaxID=210409 RepID=A0A5B7HVY7_PORTR|nr:hypothetical protein [Portunus trituberculatus]